MKTVQLHQKMADEGNFLLKEMGGLRDELIEGNVYYLRLKDISHAQCKYVLIQPA